METLHHTATGRQVYEDNETGFNVVFTLMLILFKEGQDVQEQLNNITSDVMKCAIHSALK